MLRLPKFKFLAPSSIDEASSLLKDYEENVKLLAGGTDILPLMKDRVRTPEYVLDLNSVSGLKNIRNGPDGEITIGALSTLTAIVESPLLNKHFSALVEAAGLVGSPPIRNMGTLGGNIALETRCLFFNKSHAWRKSVDRCLKLGGEVCHVVKGTETCQACFVADTVPALIALHAQITIYGPEGKRQCLLKKIYTQNGKSPNALKSTDIITEVILPLPEEGSGSSYKKLMLREAIDFPLAGVAAHVTMNKKICRDVKIVLGGVGSGPIEVTDAEKVLKGKPISEELIQRIGDMAKAAAHPVANMGSTPSYRKKMVGVLTRRALREAITKAGTNPDKRGKRQHG